MKPITNDTPNPMYVCGVCIQPGETRLFEDQDLPPHLRAPAPPREVPAPAPDTRLEWLERSVKDLEVLLAERQDTGWPVVPDDDLSFLLGAEHEGQNRKGAIKAIDEARIERASQDTELETALDLPIDVFIETIEAQDPETDAPVLSKYQIHRLLAMETAREGRADYTEALTAEWSAREGVVDADDGAGEDA